jgi:hypothetical protein
MSRLAATTALVVIGLGTTLVAPAYAATESPSAAAVVEPVSRTVIVTATSVDETRAGVSNALADNGAAEAWPKVDADLTPQLQRAVADGGGTALTQVIGLPFKIRIHCEITFPPLQIKCTVDIIWDLASS